MGLKHDRRFLRVMEVACDRCLYSRKRIVSVARRNEILDGCAKTGTHFVCHKASSAGIDAMCRAHWDKTKNDTLRSRLAQILGVVQFVKEEDL